MKCQVSRTQHEIPGFPGVPMKFQVSRTDNEFPRFPGQIMKFQVLPDACEPCHCDRVRRDGLVTRAEDRCCVECPSALIRCGGLNPTCRKPSGAEPSRSFPRTPPPRRPSSSLSTRRSLLTRPLDSRPSIHPLSSPCAISTMYRRAAAA